MASKGLAKGGAPIRHAQAKCPILPQPFLERHLFEVGHIDRGCEGPVQYWHISIFPWRLDWLCPQSFSDLLWLEWPLPQFCSDLEGFLAPVQFTCSVGPLACCITAFAFWNCSKLLVICNIVLNELTSLVALSVWPLSISLSLLIPDMNLSLSSWSSQLAQYSSLLPGVLVSFGQILFSPLALLHLPWNVPSKVWE